MLLVMAFEIGGKRIIRGVNVLTFQLEFLTVACCAGAEMPILKTTAPNQKAKRPATATDTHLSNNILGEDQ